MSLLQRTIEQVFPQDSMSRDLATSRLNELAMPHWALGDLMDLAVDLAGMVGNDKPMLSRKAIITMAADHGVVAENVSKYPSNVTAQMVQNFLNGGAAINALAKQAGTDLYIVDMGVASDVILEHKGKRVINKKVGLGTGNIAVEPAMSKAMATRSVESGIDLVNELADRFDVFGTGDMGIGNTTPSTAIAAVVTGKNIADLTGRGTGLDDEQLSHKISVIERCLKINKPDPNDGLDILAKVGGFEIGGIAGVIIGAASKRKPIVIDGFISTAGALIANKIEPFVRDYLIFSHRSVEPGHQYMQEILGCKKPLLDLNFRLGEGTGAAIAMNLIEGAAALLSEVATFSEATVAGADK